MRRPIDHQRSHPGEHRYQLRRMVAEDLEVVMDIERKGFRNPWSRDLLRRELTHDWSTILVAEDETGDGRIVIVGFVIYWLVHNEVHILNIATDPDRLRCGVARTLMSECLARGRRAGATLATLEVRRTNVPAINLYQSFGFRSVGIRPNYYADEGEDAIVMVLDL
ncbi:MAG: ribosomal protein S18-alanine N-acetyltransferase [Myxococcales bacterium]